jgi:hypothetical protein
MFSRRSCYFFVRPKRNFLEVCVFLGRPVNAPQVRRVDRTSKSKVVHIIQVRHRDEVEAPLTDWLHEAYELSDVLAAQPAREAALKGRPHGGRRLRPEPTSGTTKKTAKASRKPIPRKPVRKKTVRRVAARSGKK